MNSECTDGESFDWNWSPISETKPFYKGKISIEKKTAAVKYWCGTKIKTAFIKSCAIQLSICKKCIYFVFMGKTN